MMHGYEVKGDSDEVVEILGFIDFVISGQSFMIINPLSGINPKLFYK